jgi:RNA polymerase sigma factor (sigma-70 family)
MSVHIAVRNRAAGERSDEALCLRAVAGDDDALEKLFIKYRAVIAARIRRFFRRGGGDVEDCSQDAAVRVLKRLPEFRPEKSSFNHWVFLLTRSAYFAYLEEHAAGRYDVSLDALEAEMIAAPGGPEEAYASMRVDEEIDKLEEEQGAAINGAFYDDKTEEEMGEELDMKARRVNYRKHQGLRAIRKGLSEVPFMSIRPKLHHFRYSIDMDQRRDAGASAQLGGEDGESE